MHFILFEVQMRMTVLRTRKCPVAHPTYEFHTAEPQNPKSQMTVQRVGSGVQSDSLSPMLCGSVNER